MLKYTKTKEKAPCMERCPVGIDIPRHLRYIAKGQFSEALAVMREKTPFPGILGRVCHEPCETVCRLIHNVGLARRVLHRFVS